MKKTLRPKARLFTILGQQLISNEVIAVIELVKNSFDADSTNVVIKLHNITNQEKGLIEIIDDGCGMDEETLATAWLEPATNFKTLTGDKQRTPKFKRLPLGEKGVGRFATDKLGRSLEIFTRKENSTGEVLLDLQSDWFEKDKYLDEIEAEIKTQPLKELVDSPHGTLIRIKKIRTAWKRKMVERLHFALGRLISPFSDLTSFQIRLYCPEFPEFAGTISNPILQKAPYKLQGSLDDQGKLGFYYNDEPLRYDLLIQGTPHFEMSEKGRKSYRKPECGPFKVYFYVWDLDVVGLKRAEMDKAAKDLLKQTSGVSIYRDGFRTMPYGEAGDDWLELNIRRVNNPTVNLSKNQVIGFVEITQEQNKKLEDKTNREGLIEEGEAFNDLKALVIAALAQLEVRRHERRIAIRKKKKIGEDLVIQKINEGRTRFKGSAAQNIFDAIQNAYLEKRREFDSTRDLLLQLAGIGLTAERLTHEFHRSVINLQKDLRTLQSEASKDEAGSPLTPSIKSALSNVELLQSVLDKMEPLYYSNRKKTEKFDVQDVINDAVFLFREQLASNSIKVDVKVESKMIVEINRGHALQVFVNLIDNSIFWLTARRKTELRILIVIGREANSVLFSDNGPGIDDEFKDVVFEPFFTTKTNGRGLGLFIVKDILLSYKYDISIEPRPKLLPGATFKIMFAENLTKSND